MGRYDGNTYFLILCIYFQMLCLLCFFSIISEEDQDKIREFLLANDFLYNKHRDQWRNTQSRERKWEELSELIGRDSKDIKQWYQSTRSKLSDIKKKKVTPSGSGFEVEGVTDKARRLWERFQFLLPHIGEVKSRTVCSVSETNSFHYSSLYILNMILTCTFFISHFQFQTFF